MLIDTELRTAPQTTGIVECRTEARWLACCVALASGLDLPCSAAL